VSDKERWQTPPEIWNQIHAEFNFDLDAFADDVTKRVPRYMQDALGSQEWDGEVVWMNPPYGSKLAKCVARGADEADKGKTVVALIPFRCRGGWWHKSVLGRASEVRCIRKRVSFIRPDGSRGNHTGACDSCLVIWHGGKTETKLTSFIQQESR
jgi:phage N-6-adenine-methyltransferase